MALANSTTPYARYFLIILLKNFITYQYKLKRFIQNKALNLNYKLIKLMFQVRLLNYITTETDKRRWREGDRARNSRVSSTHGLLAICEIEVEIKATV